MSKRENVTQWKNILRAGSAMLIAVSLLFQGNAGIAANSLEQAQQEKAQLEDALKSANELITQLNHSKEDIKEKVVQLDEELNRISGKISELEVQLEEKSFDIQTAKEQLQSARQEEKKQYESMKLRIRYMYEARQDSYVEAIVSAGSFSELLNVLEYIRQITDYDRQMLERYQQSIEDVAKAKSILETEQAELSDMKAEVAKNQEAVGNLLDAKKSELAKVETELSNTNEQADAFEAELRAQEEAIQQIIQLEAQKKARREAARKAREEAEAAKRAQEENQTDGDIIDDDIIDSDDDTYDETEDAYEGGAFVWPCPSSSRVTSDFGVRESPTAGASTNHKGIDIGAPYGASIVAAADGVVAFAGYSDSCGNYVMIDHGGGIYTVYMHASQLCVSGNEKVSAGQQIAKVGSTGISTGNHLHFGVSENGVYVNPWNYL